MPNVQTFLTIINILLRVAQAYNDPFIDIHAGRLHRFVGGYPGRDHRMPACNNAMRRVMRQGDQILNEPRRGEGASLTIRYHLPRP